ncbi:MAG: hypothetical protein P4L57_16750 [Rhizomicrobium sp.]|nr:hypothetical protein [Rhizomicrobium sp.]
MGRTIAGIVAGIVGWVLVATILNFGLRALLPGYHAAEPTMVFTLAMKIARLSIAALAALASGALVRAIAPASRFAPWIAGGIMLALFLPEHIRIWDKFPVWYHLTFLATLVPLVWFGARLVRRT